MALPGSAPVKRDKVLVMESGEDLNFSHKLLDPPVIVLIQSLDCYFSPIPELAWSKERD